MAPLAQTFLDALPRGARPPDAAPEQLERTLAALHAGAVAHWPEVRLAAPRFVAHVAARCAAVPEPDRAAELYLACACAGGDPAALRAFEARYLAEVPAFIARLPRGPELADEVRDVLRERFFTAAPGGLGRIAEYRGGGSLGAWVRAAAVRVALNLGRGERRYRAATDRAAMDVIAQAPDPELELVKHRYGPQFEAALRDAFAVLTPRERTLLRLCHVEGAAIGSLAATYGVHRGTLRRWLGDARARLLDETRRLVRERLRLTPTECESLLDAVQSRLDLALSGVLPPGER